MDYKKNKGKYQLIENFFPDKLRSNLPIHFYLLREDTDSYLTFDSRFYIKSIFHKNDRQIGGRFYKAISNII